MDIFKYNSSFIRSETEQKFTNISKEELKSFNIISEIMEDINNFIRNLNKDKNSIEYYIAVINSRLCDHFLSATILIAKGFVIDGINLVRSSYEDLWLIQNIILKDGYFKEWIDGQGVRPWKLRKLKDIEEIQAENEIIYKALCNISHCSHTSVLHMIESNENMKCAVNDFKLLLMSYYSCALQIIEALEIKYGNQKEISYINDKLMNLNIII